MKLKERDKSILEREKYGYVSQKEKRVERIRENNAKTKFKDLMLKALSHIERENILQY